MLSGADSEAALASVLGQQVGRLLGGDPAETGVAVRGAVAGLEMLTYGLFVDDRFLSAYSEVRNGRGVRGSRVSDGRRGIGWSCLENRSAVPPDHRTVLRLLVAAGSVEFALITWGLVALSVWPTVFGATLVVGTQLWRIDRFGWLWERVNRA